MAEKPRVESTQQLRLDNSLRETRTRQRTIEELTHLLRSAQNNQGHLLATPKNRLLESQPHLRRLLKKPMIVLSRRGAY